MRIPGSVNKLLHVVWTVYPEQCLAISQDHSIEISQHIPVGSKSNGDRIGLFLDGNGRWNYVYSRLRVIQIIPLHINHSSVFVRIRSLGLFSMALSN